MTQAAVIDAASRLEWDADNDEYGPSSNKAARAAEALRTHAAQLAELRQALRAYDIAGPETAAHAFALRAILTLARQLTEE